MNKIVKTIILIVLSISAIVSLSGCGNKQIFDTTYTFHTALIDTFNGEVMEVEIAGWRDYDNGDQIQITSTDGTVFLVHSSRCILIK